MDTVYIIMHSEAEDGGNIRLWAAERGIGICPVRLFADEPLPEVEAGDMVAIMGGAMSVYATGRYPWLAGEVTWLREVIESEVPLLGVCLGAQLITLALGGRVEENSCREVGHTTICVVPRGGEDSLFVDLPQKFSAFQWHSDECIPPESVRLLARSLHCKVQAFEYKELVLGIQFHLDYDETAVRYNLENFPQALEPGESVQSREEILAGLENLVQGREYLNLLLDKLLARACNVRKR